MEAHLTCATIVLRVSQPLHLLLHRWQCNSQLQLLLWEPLQLVCIEHHFDSFGFRLVQKGMLGFFLVNVLWDVSVGCGL